MKGLAGGLINNSAAAYFMRAPYEHMLLNEQRFYTRAMTPCD